MKTISARGIGLFFAGFASGALSVAILLRISGALPTAPVEAHHARQAGDRQREVAEPQPAGGIGLPMAGLRLKDIHDTFDQNRESGRPHEATDMMAPRGAPVLAVDSGTIRKLFTSKAGGLTIYQFDLAEVYCYYYAHLDRYAEGLEEGRAVRRGDVIGYVGASGNAKPDAPHLHFAIFLLGPEKRWWEGKAINPYPILIQAVKQVSHDRALLHP